MGSPFDETKSVRLYDIAKLQIEDQTEGHAIGVKRCCFNGPTSVEQSLLHVIETSTLPLLNLVMDQGVVHVESDGPYGAQIEGSIAKDTP